MSSAAIVIGAIKVKIDSLRENTGTQLPYNPLLPVMTAVQFPESSAQHLRFQRKPVYIGDETTGD